LFTYIMTLRFICKYCAKDFATADGRSKHLARFEECRAKAGEALRRHRTVLLSAEEAHPQERKEHGESNHGDGIPGFDISEGLETAATMDDYDPIAEQEGQHLFGDVNDLQTTLNDHLPEVGTESVEEDQNEESEYDVVEVEHFPGNSAGAALGEGEPKFVKMKRRLLANPSASLNRLRDIKAWEKARWLLTSNISGGARDRYFKVHKVSE
jgi:hypothetical protein